ncbi:two-component sensor histidine kinase [Salinivibrio sp. VYel9]|nr:MULTISPECIES: ATP-binding protein [unclassified Salinivibrio]MPS30918.1 two-component sensor histidine kinase [Salinivibrio sp. VYel7]MPX89541.1 two-component sensor histidine kinase [Salinivibrio sp. VYel1]MPX92319.1 two-component sensor histidine kinase [Salinivibrio sp. VYel9]MPX97105.1 two-component sensor histidine kinase [Salinivibrio sp. VYel6]MPX98551.1 two-component sensor histidine kinase [Salinivibrio sp. VYel4]
MSLALFNQLAIAICIVDHEYTIESANACFFARLAAKPGTVVGRSLLACFPDHRQFLQQNIDSVFSTQTPLQSSGSVIIDTFVEVGSDVAHNWQDTEFLPIPSACGVVTQVAICFYRPTALAASKQDTRPSISESQRFKRSSDAYQEVVSELKQLQGQLLQSEKMASIGQISAGIAHEINNPIAFISSNIRTLYDYLEKFSAYVHQLDEKIDASENKVLVADRQALKDKLQLSYLLEDASELIEESLEGVTRVMTIVKDLKEFSRADNSEWVLTDVRRGIDSTLKIIHNEIKYAIEIERNYSPQTPDILCQPMQLNQVFLNLLINAAQAIEGEGKINIDVAPLDVEHLMIKIKDTGLGIPDEVLTTIFEPFYTTKPVGQGTGLGLSVSRDIIAAHGGQITVESEQGKGTTFTIVLPCSDGCADEIAPSDAEGIRGD